jgi:hypothetical protein
LAQGFADVGSGVMSDPRIALARVAGQAERTRAYEDELKFQSDLLSVTFDKAASYLNLVKIAGYGGLFALLTLMGDALTKSQRLWSGLLIGSSLLIFVLFEVYKSILLQREIMRVAALVSASPNNLEQRKRAIQDARNKTTKAVVVVWSICFSLSLGLGVAAALVLLGSMAWNLLS